MHAGAIARWFQNCFGARTPKNNIHARREERRRDLLLGTNSNRVESSRDVTNSNENRGHNTIDLIGSRK